VLLFTLIGRVLFRSDSLGGAGHYLSIMFGFSATGFIDETFFFYFSNSKWILLVGILLSMPVVPFVKKCIGQTKVYRISSAIGLLALFVLSLIVCIKSTYNPFIYFNF
jgi:hypothetical protein